MVMQGKRVQTDNLYTYGWTMEYSWRTDRKQVAIGTIDVKFH